MKQVLMSTLVLGVAIGSFANPVKERTESAFFGKMQNTKTKRPKQKNTNTLKSKQNTFFMSYKVLGADTSNNSELVAYNADGDLGSEPQTVRNIYFDWGLTLGHNGTVGFNFDDNFFSILADLCYIKHSKDHSYDAQTEIFISDPPAIWEVANSPFEINPFNVSGRNTIWKGGVFIRYNSYTHSRFFLAPYAGPHVLSQRIHLMGTIVNDLDPAETLPLEYIKKIRGFGPLLGTTGKFYFNKDFFVFGDLRLAGHFVRTKLFRQNLSNNLILKNGYTVRTFGLFIQEGVGFGLEKIRNDFRFDFIVSYEAFKQFFESITYHTLGVTVTVGF